MVLSDIRGFNELHSSKDIRRDSLRQGKVIRNCNFFSTIIENKILFLFSYRMYFGNGWMQSNEN